VANTPAPVTVLRVVAEWAKVAMEGVNRLVGHTPAGF
jgi:hypothetical protein